MIPSQNISTNNIDKQPTNFLGTKTQPSNELDEALKTINQDTQSLSLCHLCSKDNEQMLNCKDCPKQYCFKCVNKQMVNKDSVQRLLSSDEEMNNWTCFSCRKECLCNSLDCVKERKPISPPEQKTCLLCKSTGHLIPFDEMVKIPITEERRKMYILRNDAIATILQSPIPRNLCKTCFNSNPVNEYIKENSMNRTGGSDGDARGSEMMKRKGMEFQQQQQVKMDQGKDSLIGNNAMTKGTHFVSQKMDQFNMNDNEKKEMYQGMMNSTKVVLPTYNSFNQQKQQQQQQSQSQQQLRAQQQQQQRNQGQSQPQQQFNYPENNMPFNLNDYAPRDDLMSHHYLSQQMPPHLYYQQQQQQQSKNTLLYDMPSMNERPSSLINNPNEENLIVHQVMLNELFKKLEAVHHQNEIHSSFIQFIMCALTEFLCKEPSPMVTNSFNNLQNTLQILKNNNPSQSTLFEGQSVAPGPVSLQESNNNPYDKNQGRASKQQESAQMQDYNKASLPSSRNPSQGLPMNMPMPGVNMPNMPMYPNMPQPPMNMPNMPMQSMIPPMGMNHPMMSDNNPMNNPHMMDIMKVMNDPMMRNLPHHQQPPMMNPMNKMGNPMHPPMGNMMPNMNSFPNHPQMMPQKNQMSYPQNQSQQGNNPNLNPTNPNMNSQYDPLGIDMMRAQKYKDSQDERSK